MKHKLIGEGSLRDESFEFWKGQELLTPQAISALGFTAVAARQTSNRLTRRYDLKEGHLVLDADWYGPEFGQDSDPTKGGKVAQVREIIAYGQRKGVGVWLYLNDVGGRQFPIEQTLRQYGEWGAAGVRYGFMKARPSEKNERTRRITELCAQNKLLCDFHDGPVHPYGQMRTWPNAVTREFCHAQLDAHRVFEPKTFVTTVFVNMLAGPLDMNVRSWLRSAWPAWPKPPPSPTTVSTRTSPG